MQIFNEIDRQKNQAFFILSKRPLFSGHTVQSQLIFCFSIQPLGTPKIGRPVKYYPGSMTKIK